MPHANDEQRGAATYAAVKAARLDGRGVLFIPESLQWKEPTGEADDLIDRLTEQMKKPLPPPTHPRNIIPYVIRGKLEDFDRFWRDAS